MNWLIAAIVVLLAIFLFQQSPSPKSRRKRRTVTRPRQSLAFSDKEIKQIARKLGIGEARTRELAAKGRIRRL